MVAEDASSSRFCRCHFKKYGSDLSSPSQFSTSTLMPPPHRFLAPRLRGYVCRACLSKSRVIPQQQPSWLLRNATNGRGPPQVNGGTTQDDLPDGEQRPYDPIMGDSIAAITKRTEELEAFNERVETISDYSTLSVEDRTKLREELLNTLTIST